MKLQLLYILLLLILGTACLNESSNSKEIESDYISKNNKFDTVNINIEKLQKSFDATQIIKNTNYVELEATSESLIGEINSVRIFDDKIFVFDQAYQNVLFVFNMDGKFINKIGFHGSGPGEYSSLANFTVNTFNNTVELLTYPPKIIKYDFRGNFIEEYKFDYVSSSIANLEKDIIAVDCGTANNIPNGLDASLYIIEKERVIGSHGNIIGKKLNFGLPGKYTSFYFDNHDSWYIPAYKNFIYKIENGKLNKVHYLNFGSRNINYELINNFEIMEDCVEELKSLGLVHFIDNYIETDKFMLFDVYTGKKNFKTFIDKKSGLTSCFSRFQNEMDNYMFNPVLIHDNILVSIIKNSSISLYKEYIYKNNKSLDNASLEQTTVNTMMNNAENPILVFSELNNKYVRK